MFLEPLDLKNERKRVSMLCLGLTAMMGVTIFGYYGLFALIRLIAPESLYIPWVPTVLSVFAQYGLAVPVCLILMSFVPADPLEKHPMPPRILFGCFLVACFFLMAGDTLGMSVNRVMELLLGHEITNVVEEVIDSEGMLFTLLISVFLAPVAEELIFRKFLLDRINRLGDLPAIFLSGLLFGLFHGNFYQFFYAAWVGCLFAWIYLRSGKIRYTIGIHMAVNGIFGLLSSGIEKISGPIEDVCIVLFNVLTMGAAIAGLVIFIRNFRRVKVLKGWLDLQAGDIPRIAFRNVGMILLIVSCGVQFALHLL